MSEVEHNKETILKAGMIEAALIGSGIMGSISQRIEAAVAEGKVTIEQSIHDRQTLIAQAAGTMARGLDTVFKYLSENGYEIVQVKKEEVNGKDTSVAEEGRPEREGGPEREGESILQREGREPESSGEGSSEWARGDAA